MRQDDVLGKIGNRKGDLGNHIAAGYMIIGPNTHDGEIWRWHADSEEMAVRMASQWSADTDCCYEILKYEFVGVVRPRELPTEFIKKQENPKEDSQ